MKSLYVIQQTVTAKHDLQGGCYACWGCSVGCGRLEQSIPAVYFKLCDHELSSYGKHAKARLVCENYLTFVKIGHNKGKQVQRVFNRKLETPLSTFTHSTAERATEELRMVAEYEGVQVMLLTVKHNADVGELSTCEKACEASRKSTTIAGGTFVQIVHHRCGLITSHAVLPVHRR